MTVEELYNILEKEVDSGNLYLDSNVYFEQSGEISLQSLTKIAKTLDMERELKSYDIFK